MYEDDFSRENEPRPRYFRFQPERLRLDKAAIEANVPLELAQWLVTRRWVRPSRHGFYSAQEIKEALRLHPVAVRCRGRGYIEITRAQEAMA
jgi:hypothetical protein